MKKLQTYIGIVAAFVLLLNGVDSLDISNNFLSGSLITEVSASTDTNTEDESGEEEKEFVPATPKLASGAKTYINRNGYTVFHGYRYSDMPGNEQLKLVQERMVKRNSRRRYSGGASNFRTTNYRKASYASDMKSSAKAAPKPVRSRVLIDARKKIGYTRNIKPQRGAPRYSLRQSFREIGVAESFKRAKAQKAQRNEIHAILWAQNRTQRNDPALRKDRSRINVNDPDSRKALLKYYKKKKAEKEEFEKSLQLELEAGEE